MTDGTTEDRPGPPLPPVVYVPLGMITDGDQQQIEMRTLDDGRTALLVYTALDRLAACCGPAQPWGLYPLEELAVVQTINRFDVVLVDQPLPQELWHSQEDR